MVMPAKAGIVLLRPVLLNLAARLLNVKPGMRVLDIGTGIGSFIRECSALEPAASYVGIEPNAATAIIADIRSEFLRGDIQIHVGNAFDGNAYDREFDAVFANYPLGMRTRGAGSLGEEYIRTLSADIEDATDLCYTLRRKTREKDTWIIKASKSWKPTCGNRRIFCGRGQS